VSVCRFLCLSVFADDWKDVESEDERLDDEMSEEDDMTDASSRDELEALQDEADLNIHDLMRRSGRQTDRDTDRHACMQTDRQTNQQTGR